MHNQSKVEADDNIDVDIEHLAAEPHGQTPDYQNKQTMAKQGKEEDFEKDQFPAVEEVVQEKGTGTGISEKNTTESTTAPTGTSGDDNVHIVQFNENDPENPLNWARPTKWTVTLMVSLSVFLMPLSSSIVAPELATIQQELHMQNATEAALVLSLFVLTYCLAPLALGPLSELFGRVTVLHSGNAFYLVFNLVCGFARSKGQLFAFRILSGIGGGASLVVCMLFLCIQVFVVIFLLIDKSYRSVRESSRIASLKKSVGGSLLYITS